MLLSVFVLALATAHADAPGHDIVPDDQFTLDEVRGLGVNERGTQVVFVRSRWSDEADARVDDLWLLDTRVRKTSRLTFRDHGVHAPAVSPDDAWVYFLAGDDDSTTQVWRHPMGGGVDQQITQVADGVNAYRLSDDGQTIWYITTTETHGDDAWESLRDTFSDLHYVDRKHTQSQISRLDLNTWRTESVWTPDAYVVAFDVTEDGLRIAAITAPDADLITHEGGTEVLVLDRETDQVVEVPDTLWRADAPSPYGWLLGPRWSSDGRALAFRVDYDGYPGEAFVAEFAGGVPKVWQLPRPGQVTLVGASMAWVPGTRELCYRAADHARVRIVCHPRVRAGTQSRARAFPKGDVVVDAYAFSGDGRDVYAVVGTPTHFPEVYRLPARGNLFPQELTDLNPHVADWKLPDLSIASWTAPDGTKVEGVLETPAGWTKDDGPLPMVVVLHGGPTSAAPYRMVFGAAGRTSFAAKGWAVLLPNYRGSTGYGDAFLEGLIGHENDIEVADILAGVDAMVEQGIAQADKLAVMGWSNGGFLTNAVLTHTDRFAAASSGAGVVDQALQWAVEDTPGHVINFMQGLPWETPDAYRSASPLWQLGKVTTPLLIHVGEHDARVPPAHAKALFRALDTYLKVPSELVVYPDTGHGLWRKSHRAAKIAWDHAWFDHWVLGEGADDKATKPVPVEVVTPVAPVGLEGASNDKEAAETETVE